MNTLPLGVINYIKGLMCVFENASCVALSRVNKCSHDSLTRVLKGQKFLWQTLLENFVLRTFGKLQGGWLIIDDTIISKQFARKIENLSWIYDSKVGKAILGLQIVLIAWSNGKVSLPLAIRVYQKGSGKTKIDLACELIRYAKKLKIKPKFVAFDSWYAAAKVFRTILDCKWEFVTQLKSNRKLNGAPLRKIYRHPYWKKTGKLAGEIEVLVVRHGKKYFAASNLNFSKKELLCAYRKRWEIETIFRALHDKLGLDECQARKLPSQTAHFHLCLMAYTALEKESFIQKKTIYWTKRDCSFNSEYADNIINRLIFQSA
jgi:hypothetical protein